VRSCIRGLACWPGKTDRLLEILVALRPTKPLPDDLPDRYERSAVSSQRSGDPLARLRHFLWPLFLPRDGMAVVYNVPANSRHIVYGRRGDAREGSDDDLFVVVEGLPREPLARLRMVRSTLLPILHQLPGPIGFVAKTPQEVASNLTPLLLDVCVEGLCLCGESYLEPYRVQALAALERSGLRQRRIGGERAWVFSRLPTANWELGWEGYRESP
jgi:hypothetical protein